MGIFLLNSKTKEGLYYTFDEGGGGSMCIFGGFNSTVPFFLLRGMTGASSLLSSLLSAALAGTSVTVVKGSFMARRLEIRLEWFFCKGGK